jgi:hypothetical protein
MSVVPGNLATNGSSGWQEIPCLVRRHRPSLGRKSRFYSAESGLADMTTNRRSDSRVPGRLD